MSIIDYEIEGCESAECIGQIRLDEEGILREYDNSAKDFLGEYNNGDFIKIAYDDQSNEVIRVFLDEIEKKGSGRAVAIIKNASDKPRLVDLRGELKIRENTSYDITIWDVDNVEAAYRFYQNRAWKFSVMLSLGGTTYFDYDLDTQVISFYRYVTRKSIVVYKDDFSVFRSEISEFAEQNVNNLAAIETLCQQLYDGFSTIETVVRTALFHKDKKIQRLVFQARFDGMMGHRMMYGAVIATDDNLDDVPYYMTNAGLDPMTGLLNKRSIVEYTEDMITNPASSQKPHYMILIDIDDFKSINDNYGHQAGDKAIQLVANVLKDTVKDFGIVGRFGGDEFYIFTDKIETEEKLRSVLRAIRNDVENQAKKRLGMEKLTLTMGSALFPDYGSSYKELFALADKCMYIAKEKGKNRYIIYRPDLHQNIQVGAERKGMSSYDEQSKAINQVVKSLFLEGRNAIGDSLNIIVKGFDLDNIDIFYGKDLIALFNCGKYPSEMQGADFVNNSRYMEQFDNSGLYVMNNYNNLKKPLPEMYEMLQQKNCMSLIQLALPNPDMPEYFISFNMLNRLHRWSEAEISNLSLFGTLVYETIRGRR